MNLCVKNSCTFYFVSARTTAPQSLIDVYMKTLPNFGFWGRIR